MDNTTIGTEDCIFSRYCYKRTAEQWAGTRVTAEARISCMPTTRTMHHVSISHMNCLSASDTRGSIESLITDTAQWTAIGHHITLASESHVAVTADKVLCMPTVTLCFCTLVREYDLQITINTMLSTYASSGSCTTRTGSDHARHMLTICGFRQ